MLGKVWERRFGWDFSVFIWLLCVFGEVYFFEFILVFENESDISYLFRGIIVR